MSGHNNVFNTNQFRPWYQPSLLNSMAIVTSSPATNYPIGLTRLGSAHTSNIRITSYFDNIKFIEADRAFSAAIHIDAWHDSILNEAACTWLPTCNPDREFQHGRVIIKPPQLIHGITFGQEYASVPKVVVWLNGFDVDNNANWQFCVGVTEVTTKGFTLKGEIWGSTQLYQMEAMWIAYPSSRSNIDSGKFNTMEVRDRQQLQREHSKAVTFDKHFDRPPRVYFAFNRVDMTNEAPFRLTASVGDVTAQGMTLHLNTWDDTKMYSAEGQWIAIQDL